jgi:GxxExxY protein
MNTETTQLYQQEGYDFMAAAFEVYNQMGSGFLEDVYQECLELELVERGIPFISQPRLTLHYKEKPLRKQYTADLIVIEEIVVEIKAARSRPRTRRTAQQLSQSNSQTRRLPRQLRRISPS